MDEHFSARPDDLMSSVRSADADEYVVFGCDVVRNVPFTLTAILATDDDVHQLPSVSPRQANVRRYSRKHVLGRAYLSDLPHPLKHFSDLGRLYQEAESRLQRVVCERFELPLEPPSSLREVDRALLAAERHVLMLDAWDWPELRGVIPAEVVLQSWQPEEARIEFHRRFQDLTSHTNE